MTMYAGPNEFDRLREYSNSMEEIIPFGSSIFGSINHGSFTHCLSSFRGLLETRGQ
ncbi:MAG: hypothetical protein R2792_14620 [Saprospiraceae bacterium]